MVTQEPADVLWLADRIFTGTRYVDALLVEGGRVVDAGDRAAMRRLKATGTEVRDVGRRLVVPGLVDAHMHLGDVTLARGGVDLRGVRSLAEMEARVRAWATAHPRGPVLGGGWDQENFAERRYPNRDDLDRWIPDRPVFLDRVCQHAAVVNSAALAAGGIDESVQDPPGGTFVRDDRGGLTGVLLDNAMLPLTAVGPTAPAGRRPLWLSALESDPAAIRRSLDYALSVGLTTLVAVSADPEEMAVARTAIADGRTAPRLRFYVSLARARELPEILRTFPPTDRLRVAGVKAVADGSLGARTAWLSSDYADAPGTTGFPLWTPEALRAGVALADAEGLPPALHAIGDRAMHAVLDLLESRGPNAPGPARIEHASLTPPDVLARLDRSRPDLVVQPHFVRTDWWLGERLGPERLPFAYAYRTLLARGYRLAGSSDAPVEPLDPWTGLFAAVHRAEVSITGRATASEALDAETALRLYGGSAAEILGEPGLGRLEPGAPADLLVLRAPTVAEAIRSPAAPVAETWVGGRPAWTGA